MDLIYFALGFFIDQALIQEVQHFYLKVQIGNVSIILPSLLSKKCSNLKLQSFQRIAVAPSNNYNVWSRFQIREAGLISVEGTAFWCVK